jgi:hypothetical protein
LSVDICGKFYQIKFECFSNLHQKNFKKSKYSKSAFTFSPALLVLEFLPIL